MAPGVRQPKRVRTAKQGEQIPPRPATRSAKRQLTEVNNVQSHELPAADEERSLSPFRDFIYDDDKMRSEGTRADAEENGPAGAGEDDTQSFDGMFYLLSSHSNITSLMLFCLQR